jgi:hypothetical protein
MVKNVRQVRPGDLWHFPGRDFGTGAKVPHHPFAAREDKRSGSHWEGKIAR